MMQDVLGFPVEMNEPRDLRFLRRYGSPFWVRPRPDTGTLCLGMDGSQYGRLFLKLAGLPLSGMQFAPEQAAAALAAAMPVYETLYPHPALVKLQGHGPAAGGYAAIFRWAEGINLDPGAQFVEEQRWIHPDSPICQLHHQPLLTRLRMIDAVFDFHAFALQRGYLAVGFYDGNLIADFATGLITVCGIDWYRPLPALNDWGRMPGSSRFLSPEEYTAGAPLDEITLQYTMGALAFFFFGRRESREREDWTAGEALFRVAEQACREDRAGRFSSYVDFLSAWRQAAGRTVP